MTDENEDLEESVDGEGDEDLLDEQPKGLTPKKIVLFIVLPLLIVIGIVAGLYFGGVFGSTEPVEEASVEEEVLIDDESSGVFYEIPDIIVNLNSIGRKPRLLQISISLELVKDADTAVIEKILPRILDHFQTYLRELREDDLRGSAGIYRLRLELLARVNAAMYPDKVRDVLFREILVQ